jgi:hypothetical protein
MNNSSQYAMNWNTYSEWNDDNLAVYTLDLGWQSAKEQQQYPHLVMVALKIKNPTESGVMEKEEGADLASIEDTIIEQLEQNFDCKHIAFFTYDGNRNLIFYSATTKTLEPFIDGVMSKLPYSYNVQIEENENWDYYNDFLYPDMYCIQDIFTRTIFRSLQEHGDDFEKERTIDYHAFFTKESDAIFFMEQVKNEGFINTSYASNDSKTNYTVEFKKVHAIDFETIQEDVYTALNIIDEMEGEGGFGGWGCSIEK